MSPGPDMQPPDPPDAVGAPPRSEEFTEVLPAEGTPTQQVPIASDPSGDPDGMSIADTIDLAVSRTPPPLAPWGPATGPQAAPQSGPPPSQVPSAPPAYPPPMPFSAPPPPPTAGPMATPGQPSGTPGSWVGPGIPDPAAPPPWARTGPGPAPSAPTGTPVGNPIQGARVWAEDLVSRHGWRTLLHAAVPALATLGVLVPPVLLARDFFWSVFALGAAAVTLTGRKDGVSHWTTAAGGAGAYFVFWALIALPGIGGADGLFLTAALAAAIGALSIHPDKRW
ncbi:MAG: hypothetical protein JNL54_03445 [Kineosporiaceae bacterium]|nr:hypothetical protein [Kineosporiaceae bacterium]